MAGKTKSLKIPPPYRGLYPDYGLPEGIATPAWMDTERMGEDNPAVELVMRKSDGHTEFAEETLYAELQQIALHRERL